MKRTTAILMFIAIASFGLEPNNLYLKTGFIGGIPRGAGLSARAVAYLLNIEAGINYGHFINTAQLGLGIRLPIGERDEIFLNFGGDRMLSKGVNLKISQGAWAEVQHERSFGRIGLSSFAAAGIVLYPESNELNLVYALPVLKIGIKKEIFGFLK